jgi:hypothetical protein
MTRRQSDVESEEENSADAAKKRKELVMTNSMERRLMKKGSMMFQRNDRDQHHHQTQSDQVIEAVETRISTENENATVTETTSRLPTDATPTDPAAEIETGIGRKNGREIEIASTDIVPATAAVTRQTRLKDHRETRSTRLLMMHLLKRNLSLTNPVVMA